jgi:hypothetical protein
MPGSARGAGIVLRAAVETPRLCVGERLATSYRIFCLNVSDFAVDLLALLGGGYHLPARPALLPQAQASSRNRIKQSKRCWPVLGPTLNAVKQSVIHGYRCNCVAMAVRSRTAVHRSSLHTGAPVCAPVIVCNGRAPCLKT